jgi:hypothetical protein
MFYVGNEIPLSIDLNRSGLTVTVRVFNASNGVELLGETSVPETVRPGLYTYVWDSGIESKTYCLAEFNVLGLNYRSFFWISELKNKIGFNSGRAI